MPEPVTCDGCKKMGLRSLRHACPAGWYYAEIDVDDIKDADGKPQRVVIIACSLTCRDTLLWRPGPGPVLPGADDYIRLLRGSFAPPWTPPTPAPERAASTSSTVYDAQGNVIGRLVPPPRTCIFDEGTCKAADCPQHGLFPSGDG